MLRFNFKKTSVVSSTVPIDILENHLFYNKNREKNLNVM